MLASSAFVFPVSASGLQIHTNTPDAYKDMTLPITVTQNGDVVQGQGAFVQFVLNNGVPIYAETNEQGIARFKPLLTGTLNITASHNDQEATKTMEVLEAIPPETTTITNQMNGSVNITAPSFTANTTVDFNESVTGDLTSEAGTIEQMAGKTLNAPGVYVSLRSVLEDLGLTEPADDDVDLYTAASTHLTLTDINESNISGLWVNFTVPKDWWKNLDENSSKIAIVKINDTTGAIKNTKTGSDITVTPADNTVTFSAYFDGFSVYALQGYTPPKPLSVSVSASPSSIYTGKTSTITVTATSSGVAVPDASVSLSATATGGSISPSSGTTNTNGKFTATYTAPSTAGTYKITATVSRIGYTIGTGDRDVIVTLKPTPTPTPTYRRGGGGAAPAAPVMNVPVDPTTGAVTETTTLTVEKATLTIPAGIIVKDAAGNPLATSITTMHTPSTAKTVGAIAAYDCGPSGTTFEPAIDLAIEYDPAEIPAGFSESDLVVKMYDSTAKAWIDLDTTVDTVAHTATAKVAHFTIFALFAAPPVAPPPVITPTAVPTAVPTATPTPTPLPEKPKPWGLIIGIIVAVIIVGAAAYYFYTKKKA